MHLVLGDEDWILGPGESVGAKFTLTNPTGSTAQATSQSKYSAPLDDPANK
jgi:hypothetical protein